MIWYALIIFVDLMNIFRFLMEIRQHITVIGKRDRELREEYIKLGQALKAAGLAESGVDAKFVIQDGLVKVNGQTELQRGKKLYDGDEVEFEGSIIKIEK